MYDHEGTDDSPHTRDRIFDFIVDYKRSHDGNAPSRREIADACDTVVSCVHHHLTRLELDNRIRVLSNRSRTIEIVGGSWSPPGKHGSAGEADADPDGRDDARRASGDRARRAG